ncbi:hypothetical protein CRENBAI_023771 [Crenichthys baileyi]|uniref:Uncharacterized protein n=1 Tax=Crenichthys baileyi TaxID=28760 RepID=A0AAV9QVR7_9TELE
MSRNISHEVFTRVFWNLSGRIFALFMRDSPSGCHLQSERSDAACNSLLLPELRHQRAEEQYVSEPRTLRLNTEGTLRENPGCLHPALAGLKLREEDSSSFRIRDVEHDFYWS